MLKAFKYRLEISVIVLFLSQTIIIVSCSGKKNTLVEPCYRLSVSATLMDMACHCSALCIEQCQQCARILPFLVMGHWRSPRAQTAFAH